MRRSWLITLDFETFSAANLKKVGAWRYSRDPTTEILVMGYRVDSGKLRQWFPGDPFPGDLERAIASGAWIEAHNSFFEYCIWTNVGRRLYGFPDVAQERFWCSAAKAAAACLPRALDQAVVAAGLDVRKGDLKPMLKLTRPRKPSKKDPTTRITPELAPELFDKLYRYNRQDVRTEEALSEAVPGLSAFERDVFRVDMAVNLRGVKVDREFVVAALAVAKMIERQNTARLYELTEGEVDAPTQRDRFLKFCRSVGLKLPNLKAETIEEWLKKLPPHAPKIHRELLALRAEGSRSSISKYKAFLDVMDPYSDRVHGLLLYFGANATGRWAGRLVQPQNFPRGDAKGAKGEDPGEAMCRMVDAIKLTAKDGKLSRLREFHESPTEVLSTALRGAFIPTLPDHVIGAGDYSAIEARCLFWIAQDPVGLDVYHKGRDIYRDMGSVIFGKPPEELDVGFERMMGKTTVLGCGYGMAAEKFQATCKRAYGVEIPLELAQRCVGEFRRRYKKVPELWYGCDRAAKRAIQTGAPTTCGLLGFRMVDGDLLMRLPSGRSLRYRRARVSGGEIVFTNGKGRTEGTYGGKLVENACQATARELLADATIKAERHPDVRLLMHAHDELVAEGRPGAVGKALVQVMEDTPAWADGLPIKVEAWEASRYHK